MANETPNTDPKGFGSTLGDSKGRKLRFYAIKKKDGSYSSRVTLLVKEDKKLVVKQAGVSAAYPDYAAAQKGQEAWAKAAAKQGWKASATRTPGQKREDSFDLKNLPAAE